MKLNATAESADPLIFLISVDREYCDDVMDFTNRGNVQRAENYKIGFVCKRHDIFGGRFAILGTEFADMKVGQRDQFLPGKWLRKMLTIDVSRNKEIGQ